MLHVLEVLFTRKLYQYNCSHLVTATHFIASIAGNDVKCSPSTQVLLRFNDFLVFVWGTGNNLGLSDLPLLSLIIIHLFTVAYAMFSHLPALLSMEPWALVKKALI